MTEQNPQSSRVGSGHAQQGETYRMMGIREQVKNPTQIFHQALNEFNEAIGDFCKITPHDDNKLILVEERSWTYAHRGATCFQLGLLGDYFMYEKALEDFAIAIQLNSKYAWAYAQQGETYRWLGISNFLGPKCPQDYFEKGINSFSKAIELAPDYAWAYAHRGATHRFCIIPNPPIEQSLQDFDKSIELNPKYAWAYAYRSVVHRMGKNGNKAYADLSEAINIYPDMFVNFPDYNWPISRILTFTLSQIEQANQILVEKSDDPYALYVIALSKAQKEGIPAAKAEIEKAQQTGIV